MSKRKTIDVSHTGDGADVRVPVENGDPARYAAEVVARRMYGRRGYCRVCRLESWAADGSSQTWEAFIGHAARGGGTDGHNIRLYV